MVPPMTEGRDAAFPDGPAACRLVRLDDARAVAAADRLVAAQILDGGTRAFVHPLVRDATRAAFVMVDHPGLFSRLAGALALVGANVVDARTYTTRDGYATAVFWVQDAEGKPYSAERLPQLKRMIFRTLAGEVVPRDALTERDKPKKRDRAFRFPTHVTFDNEGSDIHTIIEVDARDRPGLLYDLTRTLAANHIQIVSAVIATYGAQVVDSFYVKDMFGLKMHQQSRRDALERKLRQSSLITGALAEGRTSGQDVLAAARADYARFLGTLYDEGLYDAVIDIRLDGVEAAGIAPLDAPLDDEALRAQVQAFSPEAMEPVRSRRFWVP